VLYAPIMLTLLIIVPLLFRWTFVRF